MKKIKNMSAVVFVLFIFTLAAQSQVEQKDETGSKLELNQSIRTETISSLSLMLNDYVYPALGEKVSIELNKKLDNGAYDGITDFKEFARIVTADMYQITNDNHLRIRYAPEDVMNIKNGKILSGNEKEAFFNREKAISAKRNFGFKEVKIFPGNIGYLRFNEFERAEFASNTAHAAIEMISNTNALIIDLRNNTGGWGSMVQLLLSYFVEFQDEKNNILLFEKFFPYKNETIQYRVVPYLPGRRITETPLYILTSKKTYSAAEAFVDVLQKRNRAIVIGETTRGGAHSTRGPEILTDNYIVKMPVVEVFNSQTKKNWEGTGIEPNIKKDSKYALDFAFSEAISKNIILEKSSGFRNNLGYAFLNEQMIDVAITIFEENVKRYPESANAYDSLAEAYMKNGQKELAIKNYKKSLELDPDNENAKEMLNKLKN